VEGIKVNALVLRAVDYGENDKILTLLTAERGRLTAGIKGVKKGSAKLRFAAQPFCFAEYILACRGERYTVTQASECESFYELSTDVNKFYAASCVCEAALNLTAEEEGEGWLFSFAVKALRNMCSGDESFALITFLLSALKCAGYGITLPRFCPSCGMSLFGEQKLRFDLLSGTFSCWQCSAGVGVSSATYSSLCAAATPRPNLNYAAPSSEGNARALKLLHRYISQKTDLAYNCLKNYLELI